MKNIFFCANIEAKRHQCILNIRNHGIKQCQWKNAQYIGRISGEGERIRFELKIISIDCNEFWKILLKIYTLMHNCFESFLIKVHIYHTHIRPPHRAHNISMWQRKLEHSRIVDRESVGSATRGIATGQQRQHTQLTNRMFRPRWFPERYDY